MQTWPALSSQRALPVAGATLMTALSPSYLVGQPRARSCHCSQPLSTDAGQPLLSPCARAPRGWPLSPMAPAPRCPGSVMPRLWSSLARGVGVRTQCVRPLCSFFTRGAYLPRSEVSLREVMALDTSLSPSLSCFILYKSGGVSVSAARSGVSTSRRGCAFIRRRPHRMND